MFQCIHSIFLLFFNIDLPTPVIIVMLIIIIYPASLVRYLEKISGVLLVGNVCLVITILSVLIYCITQICKNGVSPDITPFNSSSYQIVVGFAIYSFEGVGMLMPIMQASEKPKEFNKILIYAFLTILALYIGFSEICYFCFGNNMTSPIIIYNLP